LMLLFNGDLFCIYDAVYWDILYDLTMNIAIKVYIIIFISYIQGYSLVPPEIPNSTAQQPRQTRQKGAYQ
jgi:hypothetical protein